MDKEAQLKFDSLPQELKTAITSGGVPEKLASIGKKHSLPLDKSAIIEEETARVMLGIIHPNEFVDRIEERLDISTDEAISITKDVNVEIFFPIREALMRLHNTEVRKEEVVEKPLNKEKVLDEIENPTPSKVVDSEIPSKSLVVESPEEEAIVMMRKKMTHNTSSPMQKVILKENPNTGKLEKPKGYAVDPYREAM